MDHPAFEILKYYLIEEPAPVSKELTTKQSKQHIYLAHLNDERVGNYSESPFGEYVGLKCAPNLFIFIHLRFY